MMTRLRLCGWSTGLKLTDAIPHVFRCCVFGFSLITSQLFISWKWKQNHGYWSLNVFLYVLMIECFELMILCVGICKIFSCILFLEGTLTISRNFFKLKIWISQILMMKVSSTFSKFNHTVNQDTKSLTLTPTSFLRETCFLGGGNWGNVLNYVLNEHFTQHLLRSILSHQNRNSSI